MNILSNLEEIANIIIRPSRYTYKLTDLGNKSFVIDDKPVQRQDFEVKNPRGLKIKCSLYSNRKTLKSIQKLIIYLHCNSGCRVEGLAYLKLALEQDFSYLVFDFTGSGMSEGKYVSLGFYETIDLQSVYLHVKSSISEKAKIVLWGRSMGAVTALNFLLLNKYQIFMAIFDSPFKSLKQLFILIGRQKTSFPQFILQMAYNYLKPIVQQKAEFDVEQVDLKLENNSICCPGIFIASKQDCLVPFQQIDEIFRHYKGQKQMLFIEQGHNQSRNTKVINDIFHSIHRIFTLAQNRQKQQKQREEEGKNYFTLDRQKQKYTDRLERKQLSRKKLQLTIKSLSQRQLLSGTINKITHKEDEQLDERRNAQTKINFNNNVEINIRPLNRQEDQRQFLTSLQRNELPKNKQGEKNSRDIRKPSTPVLEKKPISCLISHKKSLKMLSIEIEQSNRFSFQQDTEKKIIQANKSESKLKVKKKPFQIKNFFGNQNATTVDKQRDKQNVIKIKDTLRLVDTQRNQPKLIIQKKTEALKQKNLENNIFNSQASKQIKIKNNSLLNLMKPQYEQQTINDIPQVTTRRIRLNLAQLQLSNPNKKQKQKEEPHSEIKTESHHLKNMDFHEDFVKEKQFLKRCESLQKVFRTDEFIMNDKKQMNETQTQTYRQIKCTERVLEKIIEKQERKMLILNLRQANIPQRRKDENQKNDEQNSHQKQRKTMQHIVNKAKPFVQLRGIKNYRSSFESKYKTELRK